MKLFAILVVLATMADLSWALSINTRMGSFLSRAFGRSRSADRAVPRVSVQTNARNFDRFLMNTFTGGSNRALSGIAPMSNNRFHKIGGGGGSRSAVQETNQDLYDVILVLDSSGSIGSDEFLKAKQFMTDIVSLLPATISRDNTRVACISFSDANKITTEFNFNSHTNKNSVLQAINRISYHNGGSTHTTRALQAAKTLFESAGRRNAQKVLFVATDGRSNGGGNPAVPANQMKNSDRNDVKIVVVAVSHNVNTREVQAIASSPASEHVYYVNSFTEATHMTGVVRKNMMSRGLIRH